MKKIFYYVLALCISANASCSKEPAEMTVSASSGKYSLPAISASFDESDTRTSLGNNSEVNWSNNDRIAVVNLKTNVISYYVLTSGVGTSVGRFEPVNADAPAKFDNLDDIKAVYPAIAATVAGGKISLAINKEYTETERLKVGINSWTPSSSAYAFTNNDIKVSYKTSADFVSGDANVNVNFKFRQLATWCKFTFDFTASDYKYESMESIKVTTTAGTKKISGTAEVDFSDPNNPVLKEGTENAVEWKTSGALSSSTLTKSLMLFPVIDGDQLKIEVSTNLHTFTFYATPMQAFTAGTILQFPISVNRNFEQTMETRDFAYSVTEKELTPFYFYGDANCLLLANTTGGTLDVTPRKTNAYYWVDGDLGADVSAVAKPQTAKVIWREVGITSMAEPTVTASGNKYTLNIADVQGNGNALVGIYDADDNLLWSYHIWKPEIDPRETLRYEYTNSGPYDVMPIALGATAKVDISPSGTATANTLKTYGLYYQWGRKDPLGRSANLANNKGLVTTYSGATGTTPYTLDNMKINIVDLLGGEAIEEKDGKPIDVWMLNYVTANPAMFIIIPDNTEYSYNWIGKSDAYLWGNPQGYDHPRNSQLTHRSIFDPCPKNYRVAPRDLYIGFTKSGANYNAANDSHENDPNSWAENYFNIQNTPWNVDHKTSSLSTQRGCFLCYEMNEDGSRKWQEGKTDFYPASGLRERTSGALLYVGTVGYSWSSSPYNANAISSGSLHFNTSAMNPLTSNYRARSFPVRCVKEH